MYTKLPASVLSFWCLFILFRAEMKARALVLTSVRGLLKVTKHSSRCASINAVHVCVGNYSKSSYSCRRSLETRRRLYTFSSDPITKSSESDEADTPPHISDHSEDSNDFATTYESEVDGTCGFGLFPPQP